MHKKDVRTTPRTSEAYAAENRIQTHKTHLQREINPHNKTTQGEINSHKNKPERNKLSQEKPSSEKNKFSHSGCLDIWYDISKPKTQHTHMHPYIKHIN
jgi:hypothetical protein